MYFLVFSAVVISAELCFYNSNIQFKDALHSLNLARYTIFPNLQKWYIHIIYQRARERTRKKRGEKGVHIMTNYYYAASRLFYFQVWWIQHLWLSTRLWVDMLKPDYCCVFSHFKHITSQFIMNIIISTLPFDISLLANLHLWNPGKLQIGKWNIYQYLLKIFPLKKTTHGTSSYLINKGLN